MEENTGHTNPTSTPSCNDSAADATLSTAPQYRMMD
jgi:hypothetical protein